MIIFLNFEDPNGDERIEVFAQGTLEARNFIFKTSVGLYSIIKGISEIELIKRE